MAIDLRINHLERMVTGVAHGAVTLEQMDRFAREFSDAGLYYYKKLIDVSAASSHITSDELASFANRFRDRPKTIRSGPVAIVVDVKQGEIARVFAQVTGDDRPTRVFHSIHEARSWLYANS